MAGRAHDLALRDLVEDASPTSIRERLSYVERLVAEMVELEDDRVMFAAVDARVHAKVLEEISGALKRERLLPCSRLVDVALAVRQVVLAVVLRSACLAEVVALPDLLPPPVEGMDRLNLAAPAASSNFVRHRVGHSNACSQGARTETVTARLEIACTMRPL
jgi:hypothetical protein